jgi:hypothetical protein
MCVSSSIARYVECVCVCGRGAPLCAAWWGIKCVSVSASECFVPPTPPPTNNNPHHRTRMGSCHSNHLLSPCTPPRTRSMSGNNAYDNPELGKSAEDAANSANSQPNLKVCSVECSVVYKMDIRIITPPPHTHTHIHSHTYTHTPRRCLCALTSTRPLSLFYSKA